MALCFPLTPPFHCVAVFMKPLCSFPSAPCVAVDSPAAVERVPCQAFTRPIDPYSFKGTFNGIYKPSYWPESHSPPPNSPTGIFSLEYSLYKYFLGPLFLIFLRRFFLVLCGIFNHNISWLLCHCSPGLFWHGLLYCFPNFWMESKYLLSYLGHT